MAQKSKSFISEVVSELFSSPAQRANHDLREALADARDTEEMLRRALDTPGELKVCLYLESEDDRRKVLNWVKRLAYEVPFVVVTNDQVLLSEQTSRLLS